MSLAGSRMVPGESEVSSSSMPFTDTQLPPLLGVTPLGPVSLSQEKIYQLKMLDMAFRHLPLPSDSEKVRCVCAAWLYVVEMGFDQVSLSLGHCAIHRPL